MTHFIKIIHFYFLCTNATIPVNRALIIAAAENVMHHMVVMDKHVRMIEMPRGVYNRNDKNIAIIFHVKGKYVIKYGLKYLRKPAVSDIVEANDFDDEDNADLFEIFDHREGFQIKSNDGKCLSIGQLLSKSEGNLVESVQCDDKIEQLFTFQLLDVPESGLVLQQYLNVKEDDFGYRKKQDRRNINLI